jgi:hypothetical protein
LLLCVLSVQAQDMALCSKFNQPIRFGTDKRMAHGSCEPCAFGPPWPSLEHDVVLLDAAYEHTVLSAHHP